MIIFLDFDGMLHDIGCISKDLFRHASRFSGVLRDHPDIEVVVSSDWRKDAGNVAELAAHFPVDVRQRFVGLTAVESATAEPSQRERECWQWLHTHGRQHERWMAVDDRPDNFGPAHAVSMTVAQLGVPIRYNRLPATSAFGDDLALAVFLPTDR